jgi:hypothetical protein
MPNPKNYKTRACGIIMLINLLQIKYLKKIEPNFFGSSNHNVITNEK